METNVDSGWLFLMAVMGIMFIPLLLQMVLVKSGFYDTKLGKNLLLKYDQ